MCSAGIVFSRIEFRYISQSKIGELNRFFSFYIYMLGYRLSIIMISERACSLGRLEVDQTHIKLIFLFVNASKLHAQCHIIKEPRFNVTVQYISSPVCVYCPHSEVLGKRSPLAQSRIRPSIQCDSISPCVECMGSPSIEWYNINLYLFYSSLYSPTGKNLSPIGVRWHEILLWVYHSCTVVQQL